MRHLTRATAALAATVTLFLTATAAAQQPAEPSPNHASATTTGPDVTISDTNELGFNLGTLDMTLSGGLSSGLYLFLEPGAEFGLIPLGEGMTLGIGATVNMGYCILCPAVTALTPLNVSAWYANPLGRATLHFDALAKAFDLRQLDAYVGLTAGPSFYSFDLSLDNDPARGSFSETTFLIGPLAGARFRISEDNGFFFFAEARILAEFGYSTITLTDSNGTVYTQDDAVGRGGLDWVGGLGLRL
ncbi:hypothetical protein DL240_10065 [Lujinxingia litoralis]|uniref:Outer membrane protein beta-barrel domain-containing protein n=1 Tax=Lujinxingia litoralis TaxID=2211119 RepID=A0A328C4E3_9DELT|nr:hypothetical protein [Lujinxingia litoralis]RAL22191.1 hypothetical protein DL240_10065 [Lujinxingia litoralis]